MLDCIKISHNDNVGVALHPLSAGQEHLGVILKDDIAQGHKFCLTDIKAGHDIIKYSNSIGHATQNIFAGQHVHTHNCKTNLSDQISYTYEPVDTNIVTEVDGLPNIAGYKRHDNRVGIRNEIYIVATVGCVNPIAKLVASKFNQAHKPNQNYDGCYAITHPLGCSQIEQDFSDTRKLLQQIVRHPNAGGVLVMGLGCENNRLSDFIKTLGDYDSNRIKSIELQNTEDDIEDSLLLLNQIYEQVLCDKRQQIDWSDISIGLKCGGSDGLSGITANPLLGLVSDTLVAHGSRVVMSEVPEMFGAEHILMNRCRDDATFKNLVNMINKFKQYFINNNMPIYENPSPGNKDGGITTLEDKSLGCIQKSGKGPIVDVLDYANTATKPGVSLLYGPGNDLISSTNLAASGCNLILFTTGRGTPFSCFVPTVKVSTNSDLANKKSTWIDFNAGQIVDGVSFEQASNKLLQKIASVINGEKTKSEYFPEREIAIFKTGVTL